MITIIIYTIVHNINVLICVNEFMYVCICHGVNEKDLREAVDNGAQTVRDVRRSHGVGSQCGKCVCHAAKVIKEAKAELNYDLAIAI